jgi:hypothetical protein
MTAGVPGEIVPQVPPPSPPVVPPTALTAASSATAPMTVSAARVQPAEPGRAREGPAGIAWSLIILLLLTAGYVIWTDVAPGGREPWAVNYGFLALGLLYLLSVAVTGRVSPLQPAMGTDHRLSTSKFQFLLWTAVIVFTYAWYYALRADKTTGGPPATINDLPENVLIAMGMSAVTLAGAKAITTSYLLRGLIDKPEQAPENASAANLVANDNDAPDLTKIQMLVWTFIAVVVYLVQVAIMARTYGGCTLPPAGGVLPAGCRFPDIDAALMVLMGLGQGTYLGNKLVTINTPRISSSTPASGAWGTPVALRGQAFGASPDGQQVTVDDRAVVVEPADWTDSQITLRIPPRHPDGTAWRFHQTVQIGLIVNGRRGVGAASFQIVPPRIAAVEPAQGPAGTAVVVKGSGFGVEQGDSGITFNGAPTAVRATRWTDTEIAFPIPAGTPAGSLRVGIRIYGENAPGEAVFTVAQGPTPPSHAGEASDNRSIS